MNDHLEKLVSHLELAAAEVQAAHKLACHTNPLLQILLLPLIGEIVRLKDRVKMIEEAVATSEQRERV